MAVGLTPKALSPSNPTHRYGIWVPAFAGMSGFFECHSLVTWPLPRVSQ
jgi:hypothetical protein